MKFLIPTKSTSKRAYAEISALQKIGKHDNVIELLTVHRHTDQIVLVFPYFEYESFSCLISLVNLDDIRCYI